MINRTLSSIFKLYFLLLIISFSSCETSSEVSAWDAVDSNSVLVFESGEVPLLSDKTFDGFFSKKSTKYISTVQKASKENFEILYTYVLTKEDYDSLINLRSGLKNQKIGNRQFNGIEIYEVKNGQNEIKMTYAYLNGIFVFSKSALLIENAIRVFQNKEERCFKLVNSELFQFPSLKSDQGNLYFNVTALYDGPFSGSSLLKSIPFLSELSSLSVYDVKSVNGFLSLNGFSLGATSSLSLFQKQRPTTFKIARYVPNYSTTLVDFGFSDIHSFSEIIDSTFLKTIDIGSELAFISTENRENSLVAILEISIDSSQNFAFVTDYSETYSNYKIRSVSGEVLKRGFGKIFPDILFNYCTVKDNFLILSQSVEELKSIIDAIESDDTWGKTQDYQKFIGKGLLESNVTVIFRKPDLFSGYKNVLKGYPKLIDSTGLSQINWYSMQMSALDNHFYSAINFSPGSTTVKSPQSKPGNRLSSIELPGAVLFASIVKSHVTGLQEILVQDKDLMVYLISLREGIIWKRQLDEQIQEPLFQLDYYKNGKLQYFFSTKSKLHIIDRLGRDLTSYPKSLPADIQFSGLVDYDNTRNYRFLISSTNREVSLLDKESKNINEWGPKKFDKGVVQSPRNIKVGGKDYFIVFLAEGIVRVFNRQGELTNNFQMKDKGLYSGDVFFESGNSSATSYLYYISKEGAVTKQNIKGEILTTNNLLRGRDSRFELRRVTNREEFYFCRIDTDKVVVFTRDGNILFEKQNSGSTNVEFQCVEAKNGEIVFSLFDIELRLVQVFDKSGKTLTPTPIESDKTPLFGMGKSKSDWGIFSMVNNSIVFSPIR